MPAYGLAHLHNPNAHPDVVEYIDRIQDTMDPYGDLILVDGVAPDYDPRTTAAALRAATR